MSTRRVPVVGSLRSRIDTEFATPLSRRVGGALLVVAGLVNAVVGASAYAALGSESAFHSLLAVLGTWWPESALLDAGGAIAFLFGDVAPVLAALVFLVGLAGIGAGVAAVLGRGYRPAIATAAVGSLTIVTLPLCAIAAFLCWASEDHFE